MAIALRILAVRKETLRYHQMQIVLCPGHRDIEETALLFDLGGGPGAKIRRQATVDHVEHKDRFPFLSFSRMDRREDQVVLVEQRDSRLVAGRIGRIERQLGEEALARRIAARDLLKLDQIGASGLRVLVDAVEMGLVPQTRAFEGGWPVWTAKIRHGADERC